LLQRLRLQKTASKGSLKRQPRAGKLPELLKNVTTPPLLPPKKRQGKLGKQLRHPRNFEGGGGCQN